MTADGGAARVPRRIALAFFLSGAAGLILEVIWSRLLHLAFGANAPAVSTVLAIYMGGLAAGAVVVSRWPRLRRRPLQTYAALEIGIAACALLLPAAIEAVGPLHRGLVSMLGGGGSFMPVLALRALVVGSLLVIPTAAMGATLPLLAEEVRGEARVKGVGLLYAINLAGAVVGAAAVGFVLIPTLGLWSSNLIAAGIDLVAALLALSAARLGASARITPATVSTAPVTHRPLPPHVVGALVALALSGLLAMQLQVLWSRALSVVIGSSTYAFSLILVVTLLGMAIGGRLTAGRGGSGAVRAAIRRLGTLFLVAAISIGAGAAVVDRLPAVVRDAARLPHLTPMALYFIELFAVALVVLVPAAALGGVLPCALQIAPRHVRRGAGAFVGRAYAFNTVGAIVGSLLGGFVTVPLFGVDRGMLISAAAYGLMAALVFAAAIPRRRFGARALARPALIAALALAVGFAPGFDVLRWSAGFFRIYLPRARHGTDLSGTRLAFHHDGIIATVTVEDHNGTVALKVNGKVDASSRGDMPTQVLSGLLPLCFREQAQLRRGLIIGFGSGVTAGALLGSPIEELDIVELEEAVIRAGPFFAHVSERPWADPRARVIIDDGRNFLERGGEPYDVIVSEPSNPWMSGAASLFTQEFWRTAHARLAEHGVFLQWIQLYELDELRIRSLIRTFSSVFEHVMMFSAHSGSSDTFLVGARQPLALSLPRVRALFDDPGTGRFFERGSFEDPWELAGLLLLGDAEVRSFARGAPLNTDDNAYVEFRAPLDLVSYAGRDATLTFLERVLGRRLELIERNTVGTYEHQASPCVADLDAADVLTALGFLEDAVNYLERGLTRCPGDWEYETRARRIGGVIEVLLEDDQQAVVDPEAVRDGDLRYLRVIANMIEGREAAALADMKSVIDVDTAPSAWLLLFAYLNYLDDQMVNATVLINRVLADQDYLERMPQVYYYAARIAYQEGEFRQAARLARRYIEARAVKSGPTDRSHAARR